MSLLYEIFILPIEIIYRAIYLGSLQFTHNYGLSILVLSCISAVAFIPLGRLAVGTQAREKKLQMIMAPQLARIRKESKGAERQRRINNLYKRYAYHPLLAVRSAFGVALQIPFLTGAYYMILGLTQLQGQPCLMIPDLSQPDGLLWGVNALPIVMTVVNIIATLTTPGLTRKDTLQAIIIAFFFLALLYNAASALLIFWTMNNVFFLLQNLRLPIRLPRFRKPGFAQGGMNTVMAATMRSVYSLSCAGLAILIFLYVPFQSYASDPNFFAAGPLDVLLGMVRYLSLTFFVVFVLWLWFPAKAKTIPAFVAFWALSLAFVNLFVLPGHFGALDGIRFLREAALTGPMSTFKDGLLPVLVALGLTALLFAFPKVRLQLPRVRNQRSVRNPRLAIATSRACRSSRLSVTCCVLMLVRPGVQRASRSWHSSCALRCSRLPSSIRRRQSIRSTPRSTRSSKAHVVHSIASSLRSPCWAICCL